MTMTVPSVPDVAASHDTAPAPLALVVTAAGINCDDELAVAFREAGARVEFVHLSELIAAPATLDRADLIGLPGGFSYGDAVAAGRIASSLMREALYPAFVRAIERGVPIMAPCNGFQIAVQVGLLPGAVNWPDTPQRGGVSLATNAGARFIDGWCRVSVPSNTRCVWTAGLTGHEGGGLLPIAHAEGRFVAESDAVLEHLESQGLVAVRYAADDNPNGSAGDVAGICDPSGLVFGLMPHPERFTRWTQHPWWTRLAGAERNGEPLGLRMFRNAVAHARCTRAEQSAARD